MKLRYGIAGLVLIAAGLIAARAFTEETRGPLNLAQQPLFARATLPPLNMLVMGRDHKLYSPAYDDASDLDGDGSLDVGYRGWELKNAAPTDGSSPYKIDYYGYFNSFACYSWKVNMFVPVSSSPNKTCGGTYWSGDFLNYVTTSRMDALRRVLYGGWRQVDSDTETVLQGAFFPQDGHSWGKEYQGLLQDGYDIRQYTPLALPAAGRSHLFAVTSLLGNDAAYPNYEAPFLRVLKDSPYRVWNWLSIEGPVAGLKCFNSSNQRLDCVNDAASWEVVPSNAFSGLTRTFWKRSSGNGSPNDTSGMTALFTQNAVANNLCGSDSVPNIDKPGSGNPYNGTNGCSNDDFLTRVMGTLVIPVQGSYTFAVDGDDAVDVLIDGNVVASWYGGHAADRSDNGPSQHQGAVTLSAGEHTVLFRHQQAGGGDSFGLFWRRSSGASGRDDYRVRVEVCPSGNDAVRDITCKLYPNGRYKPTGILHDYGATQRMYFGLITGSQFNNLEGGVLRRNISDFATEIDPQTGRFKTQINGIANTISRFRMIGGGYSGNVTDNSTHDANWSWSGSNCPTPNESEPLRNGQCRMWGNPLAEMLYESMRYFAGAKQPTSRFADGGDSGGKSEESKMSLTSETWKDPYGTGADGLHYAVCARPYQTIISDINPSYDGDLPGSAFGDTNRDVGNVPASIAGFNAAAEGQAVWDKEFGGARNVFIGESNGVADGAPTVKSASSFGNIRGLSPEEPTKNGTYYSASVAHFARNHDLNAATGQQSLSTYSIALASPLPRIEFPVAGKTVTLMPFAKTASGTFGGGPRKPTNGIVSFYVQEIVNLTGQPVNQSVNGGRPLAIFRISYEDSEQGNDYDMDAIVSYRVEATADGKVQVTLNSEYAAGSADQNLGYVISGTTQDGIYLDVRDADSNAESFRPYDLNTPDPNLPAGQCKGVVTGRCDQQLPLTSTRVFTPSTTGSDAIRLNNPLWYAAKYGAPVEGQTNPDGSPANYFLVTNPLKLGEQLSKAFDSIQSQGGNSGSLGVAGAQVNASSFVVIPSYSSLANGHDWTGDLAAYRIGSNGLPADQLWRAAAQIPTADNRRIFTALGDVNGNNRGDVDGSRVREFEAGNLGANAEQQFGRLGLSGTNPNPANLFGGEITPGDVVAYLRGARDKEGTVKNTTPFRPRSSILGDIVNSAPVIASKRADFGWGRATGLADTVSSSYAAYVAGKSGTGAREYVYVGANDGMLHAFDDAGHEVFAYIPNAVLGNLGRLADPDYSHRYYVDGPIALGDVHDGNRWQNVLVGTMGAGGRGAFGLRVTDPANFSADDVLWEVNGMTDPDIGHVMGKPVIVPVKGGRWVALFGNGYNSNAGVPVLFAVDVMTGQVLKKIRPDDGDGAISNGLGNITVLDTDRDGLVDTVYGGDLRGNVWKFDLSSDTPDSWKVAYGGAPLYVAKDAKGVPQPITGSFEVAVGPGQGYMLYFGTGRYFLEGDNNPSPGQQVQSFYGVWDNGSAIQGSRDTWLEQQQIIARDESGETATTRNPVNYLTQRGWYIDLVVNNEDGEPQAIGERFISRPAIQSGKVLFDTYQPGQTSDCSPGGRNFRFGLNLLTGGAALGPINTVDGDVVGGGNTGGVGIGDGAPSGGPTVTLPPSDYPPAYCDPTDPDCKGSGPPGAKCSEVIIDPNDPSKSLVKQRACGRQSWRQLR